DGLRADPVRAAGDELVERLAGVDTDVDGVAAGHRLLLVGDLGGLLPGRLAASPALVGRAGRARRTGRAAGGDSVRRRGLLALPGPRGLDGLHGRESPLRVKPGARTC